MFKSDSHPTRFSAKASSATPALDDNRPPSKAAITFFALMAGKENGNNISSDMMGMAGAGSSKNWSKQQILTTYQNLKLYPPLSAE